MRRAVTPQLNAQTPPLTVAPTERFARSEPSSNSCSRRPLSPDDAPRPEQRVFCATTEMQTRIAVSGSIVGPGKERSNAAS
jgi:hypothetical protein